MKSFITLAILSLGLAISAPNPASAQESGAAPVEDEVIARGKRQFSGNKGMSAFYSGDFETAEIEFEKYYTALRRSRRAIRNTANDAFSGSINAQITAGPATVSGQGAEASPQAPVNVTGSRIDGSLRQKDRKIPDLTLDGKAKDVDFAFAKYMTALSEIQLGKLDEARESLRDSVRLNSKNYDAHMRLGLLELRAGEYDRARKSLERLDKLRRNCDGVCEYADEIRSATLELAKALSSSTVSN